MREEWYPVVSTEKAKVNMGEDATLGNRHVIQKLVKLLVVANCKLNVTRDNTHPSAMLIRNQNPWFY